MSLVLDPSLALGWYFEDERTGATEALLHQVAEHGAVVPGLWRLEIANGFQMAIRRGRITSAYRDEALASLAQMSVLVDPHTDQYAWNETMLLSDRFNLTAYDAAYLELARRRALPLATLDRKLRAAAIALGLALSGTNAS